jgi:hypothetical protein
MQVEHSPSAAGCLRAAGTARRAGDWHPGLRRWIAALAVGAVLLMALIHQPPALWAADAPERWTLSDREGQRWVVSLFSQPDPAYPAGPRLRVTSLSATAGDGPTPSHSAPLQVRDAFAGSWSLPNRSEELVPPDSSEVPAGSAQFALAALTTPPRQEGPVVLQIPLTSGEPATVVLGPGPTAALAGLVERGPSQL